MGGSFENITCQRHPLRVRRKASFLVSTRPYKDCEDFKDDMNSAYTKILRCAICTVECEKLSADLHFSVVEKKALKLSGENQYHLHINSKGNKACPCVAACKGLEKCRGYVTEGKTAVEMAWKSDLPKATSLRCVKHFESNSARQNCIRLEYGRRSCKSFSLTRCLGYKEKKRELSTPKTKKKLSRDCNPFAMSLTGKRWKYSKKVAPISPSFQNT